MMIQMDLLNLGCGSRFHPDWENVDFVATAPGVRVLDLRERTPYADQSFDVVYHSHVLEHFPKAQGLEFLRECHRLLKPDGIIRVVVPDLERIAELYLQELRKAASGTVLDGATYDWMTLELYDQTVREKSSGEMADFLKNADPSTLEFVRSRLGLEVDRIRGVSASSAPPQTKSHGLSNFRRRLLRLIAGRDGIRAYDAGRFRLSGEIHFWMYDRFSLARALNAAGFHDPRSVGAAESAIPSWTAFHLDAEPDGRICKPDSLFMEATRV
jgi:SAM-dependent methyltransferase